MRKTQFPAVVSTFVLCYLFWILLTWSFTLQELVAGAIVSLAVALFSARFFIHDDAFWFFRPARLGALIAYFGIFFAELVKANWDMAKRCYGGCKNIDPGVVRVPVNLKGDYAQAMLANSITLTPGTITLDIAEDQKGQIWYYIHWIDVKATHPWQAGEMIKGNLERGVRRIWE